MNKEHERLMEELKAAQPQTAAVAEAWAKSERANQILEGILATEEAPPRAKSRRSTFTVPRLALGAAALLLVAVGAFLAVNFLARPSPQQQVVSQPPATSSPSTSVASVTARQALAEIVALADATPSVRRSQSGPATSGVADLLEEAQALDLLRSAEVSSLQLAHPVMRKQFALWLWRGFGRVLPPGSTTAQIADLADLSPEEQQAVQGLVRAGVIQLASDGVFRGEQPLTPTEESALLARVRALVR